MDDAAAGVGARSQSQWCTRSHQAFLTVVSQAALRDRRRLVDELDACCFKGSTYCLLICGCHLCMNVCELSSADCAHRLPEFRRSTAALTAARISQLVIDA